jgi:AmiR/NasT family two-component response regulator
MNNLPNVLVYDDNHMVRHTFAMFAKETQMANVIEVSTSQNIKRKCLESVFDVIIIGIDEWAIFHQLIKDIREGKTKNHKATPIITMVSTISNSQLHSLKANDITEIIIKPSRIKNIQEAFLRSIQSTSMA